MAFPTLSLQYMACLLYLTVPLDTQYPSWSVPVGSIIVIACVYTISCTNTLSCIKNYLVYKYAFVNKYYLVYKYALVYKNYLVYKYAFVNKYYLVYKYALVYKYSISISPLDTRCSSVIVSLVGIGSAWFVFCIVNH